MSAARIAANLRENFGFPAIYVIRAGTLAPCAQTRTSVDQTIRRVRFRLARIGTGWVTVEIGFVLTTHTRVRIWSAFQGTAETVDTVR